MSEMKTKKRSDGWWIVNAAPYVSDGLTYTDIGPYLTREEAETDIRGLERHETEVRKLRGDVCE